MADTAVPAVTITRIGDEPAALQSLTAASSIELSAEDRESIKAEADH
jgi:hypothetical protein